MNPRKIALTFCVALACALSCVNVLAQATSTPFASGLRAPTKSVMTGRGNLLVAEAGNGPNTGRLSLIDRATGARRTILDGLPSGINTAIGGADPSGPSGLALAGNTIYMTIGQGDAVLAGPGPGTERANPAPSSPLLSSVLSIRASSNVETGTASFALTPADHTTLKNGSPVVLSTAAGETLTVELIVDFPNFVAEPRPDFAENVRVSNPFGVAVSGALLYVNDASLNLVRTVGVASRSSATLATFAPVPRPSPVTPPGGPFVDAVPDSVRLWGDQLLVTLLTGFPFQPGLAEVRKIDLVGGGTTTFISGLTSAIDVNAIDRGSNPDHFLTLEYSTNMLAGAPGRMQYFSSPTGPGAVITGGLTSPTSITRDPRTGDVFITLIFPGQVVKVDAAWFFVRQHYLDFLGREPDFEGWNFWTSQITGCGADAGCRDRKQVDVSRAFYYSGEFIAAHPELAANLRGTPQYNRAFVKQAYLTYLQRTCDPEVCDTAGFNFWVNILNSKIPNQDADYNEMIRAFILSTEYRARLGLS